jgi:hypothetical protein
MVGGYLLHMWFFIELLWVFNSPSIGLMRYFETLNKIDEV